MAPGERADIIVDFRGFEGQSIILYNDAPAPFPMGDIRNDYYAGAPDLACIGRAASTEPGHGPDTRIVMRFDVDRNGSVNEPDFATTLASLQKTLPAVYLETLPPTARVAGAAQGQDAQRRVRRPRPSHAATGLAQGVGLPVDRRYGFARGNSDLADLQPDRRHASDALASGECASRQAGGVAGRFGGPSGVPASTDAGHRATARSERGRLEGNAPHEPGRGDDDHHEIRHAVRHVTQSPGASRVTASKAPSMCGTATSSNTKNTT